jgi:cyclopropane fatty-acyl-phospholipid synthase-like methyltransferase
MISQPYKKTLQEIHASTPFGKRAKIPSHLKKFINEHKPQSILDFGCGKGNLVSTLAEDYDSINIFGYDPGNPDFDKEVPCVDMIVSTDVLEHVEPEHIETTIEMLSLKGKFHYHLISCAPAKLILPDGRNAHLIQEGPNWWKTKFTKAGYTILEEEYKEFQKYSKQLKKNIPVKYFYIMMEV